MKSNQLGYIATLLYCVVLAAAMCLLSFDVVVPEVSSAALFVEFVEPPVESEAVQSPPDEEVADEVPKHEIPAPVEQESAADGTKEQVQTVNPRALFPSNRGGSDAPESVGNPQAKLSDEESSRGSGRGLSPAYDDALDAGLQGRGLAGDLPMPLYPPGNKVGKVVIEVMVDSEGFVTSATFRPQGSTTSDSSLIEAAQTAALKARFLPSESHNQRGTITYIFKLKINK
ncbi:MAG: TonB family protein [Alistipes sp.]|jgi:TonB family protein|nr:TonB family protein [Alistipes sp.]